jgi:hypothetical protein
MTRRPSSGHAGRSGGRGRAGARQHGPRGRRQPENQPHPEPKPPPSPFAPKAFLSGSPAAVQQLCAQIATQAASGFADLTGTSWTTVAEAIVAQLRASGHDLVSVDDSDDLRQWQAVWYHPRGTFALILRFRPPASVEVLWQTDNETISARA